MAIEIKAVYSDMVKCAQYLEDIGSDVKIAYTDMDDFLNKKMVFNGKQIYANWQSDARSVFETKAAVIIDIFNKVQEECAEAANTLRTVIKEYENRDSELASTTLGKNVAVSVLDFKHFGNMDSADWSGLDKPNISIGSGVSKEPQVSTDTHLDGPGGQSDNAILSTRSKDRTYFGQTVKGSTVTYAKDMPVNTSNYDMGYDKIVITCDDLRGAEKTGSVPYTPTDISKLLTANNLDAYDTRKVGIPVPTGIGLDIYAKDGRYYGNDGTKLVDITDNVNKFMSELQSSGLKYDVKASAIADTGSNATIVKLALANEGKLYSDEAMKLRVSENDLFKSEDMVYRYHPGVNGQYANKVVTPSICGASSGYYKDVSTLATIRTEQGELQTKIDNLLQSTGADSVEWACNGKYYDVAGKDVTEAVLKFQSEAKAQGLQYDYVNTVRDNYSVKDSFMLGISGVDGEISDTVVKTVNESAQASFDNLIKTNPSVFGGATKLSAYMANGFKA